MRLLLLALFSAASPVLANIQVFPTRVVLSDDQKVANISVRHRGNKPGHYSIQAVFYRMTSDGNMVVANDPRPDERAALKFLKFSPRQTTLPPNLEQVVRIAVAAPKDLPPGEYRAHLHFVPGDEAEADAVTQTKGRKISMSLEAKLAVAIPVVYRRGAPRFTAKLSNLKVVPKKDGPPAFWAEMTSEGNAFAYGDLHATFVPKNGAPVEVAVAKGIASYLPKRVVSYPFNVANVPIQGGVFRLELREANAAEPRVLASAEIQAP